MKIQTPPGMRDFYPEDMRRQNWLFDLWRRVSRCFGFSEYEGPIFEFLDLYRLKSGDGIVSELFNFKDRGEREFAIRPEMTPTLARMVAAKANSLPRPIKWFSIPRMCRAEKPQRGRLREFFQWNADILGVDDPIADAEVIALAAESLRAAGLNESEVVVRINHRSMATALLAGLGIAPDSAGAAFQLIDRRDKLPPEEFDRQWTAALGREVSAADIRALLAADANDAAAANGAFERCLALAADGHAKFPDLGWDAAAADAFRATFARLNDFGVGGYVCFDPGVVRGIAYYTGVVFETYMRTGSLRALQGGGRYDDLTSLLGGPRLPGIGFGMGDAPLLAALEELQRLPAPTERLDVFLIDADAACFTDLLRLAGRLRAAGLCVDFSYRRQAVGKQFKQASDRCARFAVVLGQEYASGRVAVKDLASGEQADAAVATLVERLRPGQ